MSDPDHLAFLGQLARFSVGAFVGIPAVGFGWPFFILFDDRIPRDRSPISGPAIDVLFGMHSAIKIDFMITLNRPQRGTTRPRIANDFGCLAPSPKRKASYVLRTVCVPMTSG